MGPPCGPSERPFCLGYPPLSPQPSGWWSPRTLCPPDTAPQWRPPPTTQCRSLSVHSRHAGSRATGLSCGTSPGPGSAVSCLCGLWQVSHLACLGFPGVTQCLCLLWGPAGKVASDVVGGTAQRPHCRRSAGTGAPGPFHPECGLSSLIPNGRGRAAQRMAHGPHVGP